MCMHAFWCNRKIQPSSIDPSAYCWIWPTKTDSIAVGNDLKMLEFDPSTFCLLSSELPPQQFAFWNSSFQMIRNWSFFPHTQTCFRAKQIDDLLVKCQISGATTGRKIKNLKALVVVICHPCFLSHLSSSAAAPAKMKVIWSLCSPGQILAPLHSAASLGCFMTSGSV